MAGEKKSDEEPNKGMQITLLPLKGRLFVDRIGPSSWRLTDILTQRAKDL